MVKLKKTNPAWVPSENPGLKVGDIVEITDYKRLVRERNAVLVDEDGNELPMPDQVFSCPICFKATTSLTEFTAHVTDAHSPKPKVVEEPEIDTSMFKSPGVIAREKEAKMKKEREEAIAKAQEIIKK